MISSTLSPVLRCSIVRARLDLFRTLQSRVVLGPTQFLTAHMRAVLVDWMVEVRGRQDATDFVRGLLIEKIWMIAEKVVHSSFGIKSLSTMCAKSFFCPCKGFFCIAPFVPYLRAVATRRRRKVEGSLISYLGNLVLPFQDEDIRSTGVSTSLSRVQDHPYVRRTLFVVGASRFELKFWTQLEDIRSNQVNINTARGVVLIPRKVGRRRTRCF